MANKKTGYTSFDYCKIIVKEEIELPDLLLDEYGEVHNIPPIKTEVSEYPQDPGHSYIMSNRESRLPNIECFVSLHRGVNFEEILSCNYCRTLKNRNSYRNDDVKELKRVNTSSGKRTIHGRSSDDFSGNECLGIVFSSCRDPLQQTQEKPNVEEAPNYEEEVGTNSRSKKDTHALNIECVVSLHQGVNLEEISDCNICRKLKNGTDGGVDKVKRNVQVIEKPSIGEDNSHSLEYLSAGSSRSTENTAAQIGNDENIVQTKGISSEKEIVGNNIVATAGKSIGQYSRSSQVFSSKHNREIYSSKQPYESRKSHFEKPALKNQSTEQKSYKCDHCQKAFKSRNRLMDHFRIHSGERPYKCVECPKAFVRRDYLIYHSRIHSGERPYKCAECPKAFIRRGYLNLHSRIHSGEKPYKCGECPKAFIRLGNLKQHSSTHSKDKAYKCDVCSKAFKRLKGLRNHVYSRKKSCECDKCPKTFKRPCRLKAHIATHSGGGPYKCGKCRKSYIPRHTRIHCIEEPYKCDICQTLFSRKCNLYVHMLRHLAETPFWCNICGKRFVHYSGLRNHLVTHSNERRHKCSDCRKVFLLKDSLQQHILLSHPEKKYECNECKRRFLKKSHLRVHLTIHLGIKLYKCEECGQGFNERYRLTEHSIIMHSGEEPYKCNECMQTFIHKAYLSRHIKRHLRKKMKSM